MELEVTIRPARATPPRVWNEDMRGDFTKGGLIPADANTIRYRNNKDGMQHGAQAAQEAWSWPFSLSWTEEFRRAQGQGPTLRSTLHGKVIATP